MPPSDHDPVRDVDVSPDHETLSRTAAQQICTLVRTTLTDQEVFTLALSGGSTPRQTYERLAEATLPWTQIHLFWGDDRFVPHDHPQSNVRLVRNTLLDSIEIPDTNVHPMPTTGAPDDAAAAYADTLHHAFADRSHTFDLVFLGVGEDGHTASLFPEHDPSPSDPKWVRAVSAPPRHAVAQRLTCTLPVINDARQAFVLASGASKQAPAHAALHEQDASLPITRVRPRERILWLLDEDASPSFDQK